jgi:hypothetical protein
MPNAFSEKPPLAAEITPTNFVDRRADGGTSKRYTGSLCSSAFGSNGSSFDDDDDDDDDAGNKPLLLTRRGADDLFGFGAFEEEEPLDCPGFSDDELPEAEPPEDGGGGGGGLDGGDGAGSPNPGGNNDSGFFCPSAGSASVNAETPNKADAEYEIICFKFSTYSRLWALL